MNPTIKKVLSNHYVEGIFHTHVSMVQPRGKYQFDRQGLEDLWDVYCNKLDKDTIVGIAEKPQYFLPVLADVDIKVKEVDGIELGNSLYTKKHTDQVIEIYQSVLRNTVVDCKSEHLICVLLEKPMYRVTKDKITYAKNGFHLHFPYLFLNKAEQEVHIIPRVQDSLNELKVFEDLGFENSGDLIDKSCCKVPWLLYGSRKQENMNPYTVSRVVNDEGEEISLDDAFKHYRLYDKHEQLIKIGGNVKKYLPRILSIIPYGRQTQELRKGLVSILKEKIKAKDPKKYQKVSVIEALKISSKLLPMLSQFRSEDRNEWMSIGWILYNIGDGSPEALDQWIDFSARDEENFDESVCIYEWERMTKKDLTMGTLRYYASIDNPELYMDFKREQAEKHVKESLNGSHNDIAQILYAEYGNEFVCVSVTSKIWYQFKNHRWEEIEEGVFLRERISSDIVEKYTKMGSDLFSELGDVGDKAEEAMYSARLKQVQKMIANLKSATYKSNIMKEAAEVFYDKRFRQKLDTNPYLFGWKNGVHDLKLNIFRAGRPEDFISKCCPLEFKEYDEGDEPVQMVHDFLEKVFPDKSVRTYFKDTSSDVFVGGNNQKTVNFWTGDGDNAKSVTQMIFEKMLGELAIKFPTTLITGKKTQTGAANPELARAGNGVRWAVLEEPDGDEQINVGLLKSLSGNDTYWARDLFEKGKATREMTPMFKLTFICNKLPKMRYSDKATWNRIRVIPFEATFVRPGEPCPETYEEQMREKRFPMDKEFHKKVPDLVQAFAWVLLEHRKKVTIRIEPEKVKAATAMYRKQNDVYRQYVEENIIEDDSVISLVELYSNFKEWFKEGFPGHTLPVKNEVKEYFIRLWDEPERGIRWSGYRIRTVQDDVNSGDCVILEDDDLIDYGEDGKALPPL